MVDMILGTDMANHKSDLNKLEAMVNANNEVCGFSM